MTLAEIRAALAECSYPGFRFNLITKGDVILLQVECPGGRCNVSGNPAPWKGRKWYVSPHMTRSEIVQTAFKAVLTALEHEARESFKFRGVPVLDPHLDLDNAVLVRSERASAA